MGQYVKYFFVRLLRNAKNYKVPMIDQHFLRPKKKSIFFSIWFWSGSIGGKSTAKADICFGYFVFIVCPCALDSIFFSFFGEIFVCSLFVWHILRFHWKLFHVRESKCFKLNDSLKMWSQSFYYIGSTHIAIDRFWTEKICSHICRTGP